MSEVLVLNPRRRRKAHKGPRKMSALQAKYFGGGRKRAKKRNPPAARKFVSRKFVSRKVSRRYAPFVVRRRRHNPPNLVKGITSTAMEIVKDAIPAVAGVVGNNLVSNIVADKLLKVTGTNKELVRAGTAVALPVIIGIVMPRFKKQACIMGAAALAFQAVQMLEEKVFPTLGETGSMLSSKPVMYGPVMPVGIEEKDQKGYGYLPGLNYGGLGYLPGQRYFGSSYNASREVSVY